MRFGFLITARCNAACEHCTTSCGPRETAALPTAKIIGLMDEAAAIWRQRHAPGEGLQFCISGGEPFLDFPRLLAIFAHGRGLGASVTCVTNAFWAASDEKAYARLRAARAAGLASLAVSTSRFHQRFVKAERVQRALRIAGELGIRTVLKCAVTRADRADLTRWARASGAARREIFPVAPYLREGAQLEPAQFIRTRGLPRGRCPAPTLTVREDGTAYTCCMPGGFTEFLALGNVHRQTLEQTYRRFYLQGTQQVLRGRGPAHFARAVIAQGEGHRLRAAYESVCDLCAHIASDPAMTAIAASAAEQFARRSRARAARQIGRARAVAIQGESHRTCATQPEGAVCRS